MYSDKSIRTRQSENGDIAIRNKNRWQGISGRPPHPLDGRIAEFDNQCRGFVLAYRRVCDGADSPGNHAPRRWLRREAYRFLFKWLSEEGEGLLKERIDVYRASRRGRRGNPNPFQLGLAAIFAHVPGAIDAREREVDGLKLWYAAKHLILPGMLELFIGQWTTEELRQKVRLGRFERDLIPWIVTAHRTIARGEQFYQLPTEILDIIRQCDYDGADLSEALDNLAVQPAFNPFDIDH